jgi:DNA-directed RNA polymerase subunit M/transcription elongation factor TFIIS
VADEIWYPRSTHEPRSTLVLCIECGRVWQVVQERWRAYWTDEPRDLVFYCPECAESEFG